MIIKVNIFWFLAMYISCWYCAYKMGHFKGCIMTLKAIKYALENKKNIIFNFETGEIELKGDKDGA